MSDPTTSQEAFLGPLGILFIGLYVSSLLVVGWFGLRARKEDTLNDFYLGGRNLGFVILLFTMFATQYSGNTLMGYPGKAYRSGFEMIFVVASMVTVTAVLFIYAPRLRRLSELRGYITPGDFIQDRFGSRTLTNLVTLMGILALVNYLITNLKALGYVVENVTGGAIGFETSVAALAVVMIAYEAMGGMRSVAWTDVTQGVILFVGGLLLLAGALAVYGGGETLTTLQRERPEMWSLPDTRSLTTWLGTVILLGLGNALYPHTVQRIYASRSQRALQRSLQIMVFMPFFISLVMILIGLLTAARFPGLDATESDRAIMYLLRDLAANSPAMKAVGVIFIAAVIAATMSTIDSALLSMSAMVTADFYRPLRPDVPQERLTKFGKHATVFVMAAAVALTIWLKDKTIFSIIVFKHELLIQLAPALMIGVHWKRLSAMPVLVGMIAGAATAVTMTLGIGWPETKPLGMHAGVWGLAVNLVLLLGLQAVGGKGGRAESGSTVRQ